MYCTTFYSYKGGVGRTLALSNVAAHLATRGKKVLVVDFDLEAPGLTTLDIFAEARSRPGVVDYIHAYLRDDASPDVSYFIHPCSFVKPSSGVSYQIDVMPAGDQSASYGANFAKIDWRELYEERDGFLLIEDLREQWSNLEYDYVLVDSRTGLTDVSGICTRQLPDGVVMIFFPNEQNLVGLKEMARSIRESAARPESPKLLFVASRLPQLDDENGVLERWLERFKRELGYSPEQLSQLDQYDSLALLDQDIFVLTRPKTGLSKQYQNLSGTLSKLNDGDAQGALEYIGEISRIFSGRMDDKAALLDRSNPFGFFSHDDRLRKIEDTHQGDAVIQRHLADHYYNLRDYAHLEVVLRHGIAAGMATQVDSMVPRDTAARLHQLQMKMSADTGESELAASSAVSLLKCRGANERMVVEALMLLVTTMPDVLPSTQKIAYLQEADLPSFASLMNKFSISSREVDYNCKIAVCAFDRFGSDMNDHALTIALALIAGGEFEKALAMLGDSTGAADLAALDIPDAFNRVMALWGRNRQPNLPLFQTLLALAKEGEEDYGESANYQQCMALIYAVLGDVAGTDAHLKQALIELEATSGRREVSCWSFVEEPDDDFRKHCVAIAEMARGVPIKPIFLSKTGVTYSVE